jgi:ABC-type antimicrobial peptide transport system permease subunit
MWHLAYRQLLHELERSVLTIFAISAAIAMILVLSGFEQGLYVQSEKVVLDRGGQLIVTQSGVANFLAVRSSLPQLTRSEVEAVDGVINANPLTGFWVIYGPEGNKFPLLLLVYDTLGGPPEIIDGRPIEGGREAVIDIGLSKRFDLKPGDPLIISDFEFRIAGITRGSSALFSTFAYVSYDGMIDLFLESEIAPDISTFPLLSFLLVEAEEDVEPAILAERIEQQVPEVDVHLPEAIAVNDVELGKELFSPIMNVLILLSYIIGMLVIGLIIYADISGRQRTFGVMKALGFRINKIAVSVIAQTSVLVLLAFPFGFLIAFIVSKGIEWNMPVYNVYIYDPIGLLKVFIGVIAMMLVGSLMPLRLIKRTDPVITFKAE